MQTIIIFLIYVALTSLLHHWLNKPYKWKTVMDSRVRPEHISRGLVWTGDSLQITETKPVLQYGVETIIDGKVVATKLLYDSKNEEA